MEKIICEDIKEIKRNKKKLEKILGVKITIQEKEIFIEGEAENEYIAEKIIDAINFGFSISKALLIKKEDFLFEIIDIKNYTRRKDLQRIKARIIGTKGKTLKTLCNLTECNFEIKDNHIGIIGAPECIQNAQEAITSIIRGAKQSNVYSFLEKHRVKPVFDLGLKNQKEKR